MPAEEKDQLVRFVAEMDDRTTEMCRSLDGQIFHTKAWNRFTRYSDFYKGLHTFSWFGLEQGLNLPPINDHFHWCRSTIVYNTDIEKLSFTPREVKDKYFKNILDETKLSPRRGAGPSKAKKITINGIEDTIENWKEKGYHISFGDQRGNKEKIEFDRKMKVAEFYHNKIGGHVELLPECDEQRMADFLVDNTDYVELKTLETARNIDGRIKHSRDQADIFILDITGNDYLTVSEVERQLNGIFASEYRQWIKKIYVKSDDNLIGIYVRK